MVNRKYYTKLHTRHWWGSKLGSNVLSLPHSVRPFLETNSNDNRYCNCLINVRCEGTLKSCEEIRIHDNLHLHLSVVHSSVHNCFPNQKGRDELNFPSRNDILKMDTLEEFILEVLCTQVPSVVAGC